MNREMIRSAVRRGQLVVTAVLMVVVAGCATTNGDSRDPFESFNRSMYGFNQTIDEAVLKPVSTAYKQNLPEILQTGVRNFFSNIADIFISVNNLLQGKVIEAANDGMRFAVNTTIGGLGVLDWASQMGLEKHNEDFGQTFGWWGVGEGPYIVWPLVGASTVRDSVGGVIGAAVDPVRNHEPVISRNVMQVTRIVSRRADLLDASRILEEAALDKYIFERDAYLQRRRNLIYDGSPPREAPRGAAQPGQPSAGVDYEPGVPRNYEAVLSASVQGSSRDAAGN